MRNVDFYRSILEGGVQDSFNKAAASGRPEDLAAALGAMFNHNTLNNRILNQLDRIEEDRVLPEYLQKDFSSENVQDTPLPPNRFSARSKIL